MVTLNPAPIRPTTIQEVIKPRHVVKPKQVETPVKGGYGWEVESSFASLLVDQQWFTVVEDYPDPEYMFELAAQYHAAKLNSLLSKEGGSLLSLEELGAKTLMDMIFKVDFLLEYRDITGKSVRVSIDITANIPKVKQKEIEIRRKEATLHKLGIDRACVVLWNIKPGQPPYMKIPLLQAIRERLDSNTYFCNTIVLF